MRMDWRVKLCLLLLLLPLPAFAQDEKAGLEATIRHEDAAFWDAYNRCDVEKMSQFFWPDIEFYHDKGGLTVGLGPFVEKLKTGLCGKPNFRLRREAVGDTVKVYPLQNNGVAYGAVISGEHYFYINDSGKPEYRDGVAKFFHVWLLKDGAWKMGRVVSYDHRDASSQNAAKEVTSSARGAGAVRWQVQGAQKWRSGSHSRQQRARADSRRQEVRAASQVRERLLRGGS